jgi:hypothetical protein
LVVLIFFFLIIIFTSYPSNDRALVCFLCGEHFPSRGLAAHHSSCLDALQLLLMRDLPPRLWSAAVEIDDDGPREPVPAGLRCTSRAAATFNEENLSRFQQRFARCPGCRRRFHLPRLVTHIRGCAAVNQRPRYVRFSFF